MEEERTIGCVVVNLLWSVVLCLGEMIQVIFSSLQQCYMPYGYMFSNDTSHILGESCVYKRRTTSIFEILDLKDDVEVASFVMCEYAAAGEDSIY